MRFARHLLTFDNAYFERIIFTDESKFYISVRNQRVLVRRRNGHEYDDDAVQRVRAGRSPGVMVWAAISIVGVGPTVRLDGRVTADRYLELLQQQIPTHYPSTFQPNELIYQHDNAPIHRAQTVTNWIAVRRMNILDWPAQSPDLNLIENCWSHVKRQLKRINLRDNDQLWEAIQQIWGQIQGDYIERLYSSSEEG